MNESDVVTHNDINAFFHLAEAFWLRSYGQDVDQLNEALRKRGRSSAGIRAVPPSLFTGDPLHVEVGNCLLVLGINPKWRGDRETEIRDINPSLTAWSNKDFHFYRSIRSEYFDQDSKLYYGRYFTRLGCALDHGFFGDAILPRSGSAAAKQFFKGHAIKFDLLPWWSSNTDDIKPSNINLGIEPIREWREVVNAALKAFRPKAIVINGCGWRGAIEGLFNCKLFSFESQGSNGIMHRAFSANVEHVPLLAHVQLNAQGAPSYDDYKALIKTWKAGWS